MAQVRRSRTDGSERAAPALIVALRSLEPPIDTEGPRVRLGVLWALVVVGALVAGPLALGAALAAVGVVAAAQTCTSWRTRARRPARAATLVPAVLLPLGASFGMRVFAAAVIVGVVTAVLLFRHDLVFVRQRGAVSGGPRPHLDLGRTLAIGMGCGVAAASPALLAYERTGPVAFVLLGYAFAYDVSTYLIGSGARSRWEGPAAGVVAIASSTIAVAALLVPPFRGFTPALLGGLAMLTAPLGPIVATMLVGERSEPVPALRRLDVLVVLGPLWTIAALALLRNPIA